MKVIGFLDAEGYRRDLLLSVSTAELSQLTGLSYEHVSHVANVKPGTEFRLGEFVADVARIAANRRELQCAADGLELLAEKIRQHDPMAYFLEPEDGGKDPSR